MIISIVMPSYPNVALFLCYISEHWTTARTLDMTINHKFPKPDNIKHNLKNHVSIHEFAHRALWLLLSHCDGVICGYTLLKRLLTGLPCLILKIFEVCFYSTVAEKLVIRYPWISEPRDQWRSQIFTDFTEKFLQSSKLSKTCLFIWMHILN